MFIINIMQRTTTIKALLFGIRTFSSLLFLLMLNVSASAQSITHEVKAGESLYDIAKAYRVHFKDLFALNQGLSEKLEQGILIAPNDKIKIPDTKAESGIVEHTVKQGETLYGILSRYDDDDKSVRERNGLRSDIIPAGAVLKVNDVRKVILYELPASLHTKAMAKAVGTESTAFSTPALPAAADNKSNAAKTGLVRRKGMARVAQIDDKRGAVSVLFSGVGKGEAIRIINPKSGKDIHGMVVGSPNKDDTALISISTATAIALGISAEQVLFEVEIEYVQW